MISHIFLDSTPLGLILQRAGHIEGDTCRRWIAAHLSAGVRVIVPEIVDYEIRRELLRLNNRRAIRELDAFNSAEADRYLALNTSVMRLASRLWAEARQQGSPTADAHSLDVDVILSAQVLAMGLPEDAVIVATSNPRHIARFVRAEDWTRI